MRANSTTFARSFSLAAWLACVPALACTQGTIPGPQPSGAPALESPAFFAAAVRYFANRDSLPLRVDPRPLRPEARLISATDADLLAGNADIVRMRREVLQAAGWREADAVADWKCVFAEGYPPARPSVGPAADSMNVQREACRRNGRFQSLIFGLPQPASDPAHPQRWRIRALRMLLHGFEGIDLYVELDAAGEWRVVDAETKTGAFS